MKLFEPIYTAILGWARHPKAERFLAGVSFAESSFFPIPVDVMLAPMVLADKDKAWRLAAITTIMSVLGGMFGYLIGAYFFEAYGDQMLTFLNGHEKFERVQSMFLEHGTLIILLAGFTPLPYKVFTIASGVVGVALIPFVVLSMIGRGARFFLVAGLIKLGGDQLEETIHKKIEVLGWGTLLVVVIGLIVYLQFN